jgi:hypothetical protein
MKTLNLTTWAIPAGCTTAPGRPLPVANADRVTGQKTDYAAKSGFFCHRPHLLP